MLLAFSVHFSPILAIACFKNLKNWRLALHAKILAHNPVMYAINRFSKKCNGYTPRYLEAKIPRSYNIVQSYQMADGMRYGKILNFIGIYTLQTYVTKFRSLVNKF